MKHYLQEALDRRDERVEEQTAPPVTQQDTCPPDRQQVPEDINSPIVDSPNWSTYYDAESEDYELTQESTLPFSLDVPRPCPTLNSPALNDLNIPYRTRSGRIVKPPCRYEFD